MTPLIVHSDEVGNCPTIPDMSNDAIPCSRYYMLKEIEPKMQPSKQNSTKDTSNMTLFTAYDTPIYDIWRVPFNYTNLPFDKEKDCRTYGRWNVCVQNFELRGE